MTLLKSLVVSSSEMFRVVVLCLVLLQLGSAHSYELVVIPRDQLRQEIKEQVTTATEMAAANITDSLQQEIKEQVTAAVEQATVNITDSLQQLLAPLVEEAVLHRIPGKTPSNPARSCEEIKRSSPSSSSGYYWIQSQEVPLVQVYCDMHITCYGESPEHAASSCKEIKELKPKSVSGYYWIKSSNNSSTQVYCDMTKTCGGVTGGWMRAIKIDMTNSSHTCPSGLKTLTSPKRLCAMNINGGGCSSATINLHGVEYTRVCGKIIGYQQKTPDAFGPYYYNRSLTIDDQYVDGISLTHGHNTRKHIWTFAAANHEVITVIDARQHICPCTNIHNPVTIPIPPYVGSDYFCDTGSESRVQRRFYPNDPLWDGQGCGRLNTCCSFNKPPWFMKELPSSTSDDIEMRLSTDGGRTDEDINFESVELYVQ